MKRKRRTKGASSDKRRITAIVTPQTLDARKELTANRNSKKGRPTVFEQVKPSGRMAIMMEIDDLARALVRLAAKLRLCRKLTTAEADIAGLLHTVKCPADYLEHVVRCLQQKRRLKKIEQMFIGACLILLAGAKVHRP